MLDDDEDEDENEDEACQTSVSCLQSVGNHNLVRRAVMVLNEIIFQHLHCLGCSRCSQECLWLAP